MNHFICHWGYISCFVAAVYYSLLGFLGVWNELYSPSYRFLNILVELSAINVILGIRNSWKQNMFYKMSLHTFRHYWLQETIGCWTRVLSQILYAIQYFISDLWTARISACSFNLKYTLPLCFFSPFPPQLCSFLTLHDLDHMFCPLNGLMHIFTTYTFVIVVSYFIVWVK